ncbi:MAG: glycine betaine ABC transporter substrate-binding protein [Actinomycetota bacterium]
MRYSRRYALGATLLAAALLAGACGSGGGDNTSTTGGGGGATIASTFVFGAPPDCATNELCAIGLKSVYGIQFKQIKTTDFGGPITVHALKAGSVQIGELFSTSVYDPTFTVLEDDKHLESSDNIVPVIRADVDTPQIDAILNAISAKITTDQMLDLNKQVDIAQQDPAAVATKFLNDNGLMTASSGCSGDLTVGVSGNFSESKIMAEMYGQALEHAGCKVSYQLDLSARKVSDQALFSGSIDLKPEYLASEASAQDANAKVSGDPQNNATILKPLMAKKNVNVLDYTPAVDTNVFVVTNDTASKFGLTKVSDLAKPAP